MDKVTPKLLNTSEKTSSTVDQGLTDKGSVSYWVYVLYGFSVLSIFNSILSTLDFFIEAMPD